MIRTPARGIVAALNLALGAARAPIVARMDADDIAHPRRLAAARLRDDPHVDVFGCRVATGAMAGEAAGAGMRAYVEWPRAFDAGLRFAKLPEILLAPRPRRRRGLLRRGLSDRCDGGSGPSRWAARYNR